MTDNLPLDYNAEAVLSEDDGCECIALHARVAELERELAASRSAERSGQEAFAALWDVFPDDTVDRERDAALAHVNALRDALEKVMRVTLQHEPMDTTAQQWLAEARALLATTPRANLAAYRKSVLEEAALVAELAQGLEPVEMNESPAAIAIRALAAQEDK